MCPNKVFPAVENKCFSISGKNSDLKVSYSASLVAHTHAPVTMVTEIPGLMGSVSPLSSQVVLASWSQFCSNPIPEVGSDKPSHLYSTANKSSRLHGNTIYKASHL